MNMPVGNTALKKGGLVVYQFTHKNSEIVIEKASDNLHYKITETTIDGDITSSNYTVEDTIAMLVKIIQEKRQ